MIGYLGDFRKRIYQKSEKYQLNERRDVACYVSKRPIEKNK
jgi:hypothetical protein